MTDLTDAELDVLEAHARGLCGEPKSSCADLTGAARSLIAEVRRWRDKAADEAGLARLEASISAHRESPRDHRSPGASQ